MKDSASAPDRRNCLRAGLASAGGLLLGTTAPTAAEAARKPAPRRPVRPRAAPAGLPDELWRTWQATGLPLASLGLHVQPVRQRLPAIASLNAERSFQLASTAKVVTTLAALNLLGPDYRWRTPAFVSGSPVEGRLPGDLRILGGGDALLSAEDLLDWFLQMQMDGLREVAGDIVLDGFAFRLTQADLAGTPQPSPDRPHHAWPSAFVVDEGRLRVRVEAGLNGAAQLMLQPPVAGMRLRNRLKPRSGDCQLSATVLNRRSAAPELVVQGDWSASCGPQELSLSPWSQAEYTERAVAALWQQAGGRLGGRVRTLMEPQREGGWPQSRDGRWLQPWSVHRSEPLHDMVRDMNKTSDNLAARNLMMTMAPGFPLRAATLPGACERVQRWLRTEGLRQGDISVQSGSGLSRAERGKPRAMVHLLRRAWQTPQREAFVSSLPVAGVDGTLKARMTDGDAAGRAFLKTGTLLDTRALAGYVLGRSGTPYAVTALVNHPQARSALPVLDQLIEWVASRG